MRLNFKHFRSACKSTGTLSPYHLYTNSRETKGYLKGSFGVPRVILRPTQGAGSLLPRSSLGAASLHPSPSLAQKGCLGLGRAKQLLGCGMARASQLRHNGWGQLHRIPSAIGIGTDARVLIRHGVDGEPHRH